MTKKQLEEENKSLHRTIATLWDMIHLSEYEIDKLKFEKKELSKLEARKATTND